MDFYMQVKKYVSHATIELRETVEALGERIYKSDP